MDDFLLTIAIPTYNRSFYLDKSLFAISRSLPKDFADKIEVAIFDNASTDQTRVIAENYTSKIKHLRYFAHESNIGMDRNIAFAYDSAKGKYVLLLGDDDILIDGAISYFMQTIMKRDYGVVAFGAYGYNLDHLQELPPRNTGAETVYDSHLDFLLARGISSTLISVNIINKRSIPQMHAGNFVGYMFPHIPLIVAAARNNEFNLENTSSLVAVKRNNSGGYDWPKVFGKYLFEIYELSLDESEKKTFLKSFFTRVIITYYPFYLFKIFRNRDLNYNEMRSHVALFFNEKFKSFLSYKLVIAPSLLLPRKLSLAWLLLATIIGRIYNGDLPRAKLYLEYRLKKALFPVPEK